MENRFCLYIDESGVPELSDDGKFCVLGGVLMKEEDEKSFLFLIQRIKQKYKLPLDRHIHAVDVFERRGKSFLGKTTKRRKMDLRKKFQIDIWNVIKDYSISYYAVEVSKDKIKKIAGLGDQKDKISWIDTSDFYAMIDRQLPMDIGVNALYDWAIKKIGKNDKLKIIFESRSGDLFTARNFDYIRDKNVFKHKRMQIFSDQFKEKVVSITFANKAVRSVGLELADIISYTCNVYFLGKRSVAINKDLKNSVSFQGIHKTLNKNHYHELSDSDLKKYFPGLSSRTKRIARYYSSRHSLSPAKSGSPAN